MSSLVPLELWPKIARSTGLWICSLDPSRCPPPKNTHLGITSPASHPYTTSLTSVIGLYCHVPVKRPCKHRSIHPQSELFQLLWALICPVLSVLICWYHKNHLKLGPSPVVHLYAPGPASDISFHLQQDPLATIENTYSQCSQYALNIILGACCLLWTQPVHVCL